MNPTLKSLISLHCDELFTRRSGIQISCVRSALSVDQAIEIEYSGFVLSEIASTLQLDSTSPVLATKREFL